MEDFGIVEVLHALQDLLDNALYLRGRVFYFMPEQTSEVMVHILEHQESRPTERIAFLGFRGYYLFEFDDVLVVHRFQEVDFYDIRGPYLSEQ